MAKTSIGVPAPQGRAGILAVDAGQSSISLRTTVAGKAHQGQRPGVDTSRPVYPQLAAAITSFLDDTGADVHAVGVGSSGVADPRAEELLPLLDDRVRQVAMAHDSTTWYLGAIGDEPGVVVACGTGVVTLAVGADSVARVDGWGYLMGDVGSAFWIGRNALDAAMRGYDGRRQLTALTDVVARDFANIEEAYLELQADDNRVARVAAYAAVVDRLAPSDPVAANIVAKAAAHLAEAVVAGSHRVGLGRSEPPRGCAVGQVFASSRLLHHFTEYLTLQWPNFALADARGNALDGTAELIGLSEESPLAARVSTVGR